MNISKYNINESDKSFSDFARALALPIRVRIIRIVIENGFSINRSDFNIADYTRDNITKHIAELRSLGVIKMEGSKGNIKYTIDQYWFKQMIKSFTTILGDNVVTGTAGISNAFQMDKLPDGKIVVKEEPSNVYAHFGEFIKKHRKELHLSQADFAKRVSIDRSQLSRIECGKMSVNPDKLRIIAKALYQPHQTVRKEYYSCQLVEIIDESGYDQTVLNSAQLKIDLLFPHRPR